MIDIVFEWLADRLSARGEKDRGVLILRWVFFGGIVVASVIVAIALIAA